MDERKNKPNFLVYLAYLGLFSIALNTVFLVLPNDQLKWYLVGILVVGMMTGYILTSRHYVTIGLALDIAGLVVFIYYGWRIYSDHTAFGTYLGEMLSVMMVLRCFKLFRYQDFFAPLVISLTLMVFSAIPSFSAEFVYSLLGFMLLMGLSLFLGSVDEFARLPKGKSHTRRWKYTYDFLEDYAQVPVSKKNAGQLFKFLSPAIKASIPAVIAAFVLSSAVYFTVDHSLQAGSEFELLAAFGGGGFEQDPDQEQSLLTGDSPIGVAQYYTGFDTEFNIARGRLIENSTSQQVVMEVESNLPSYWRGKCFDTYTGRGWVQGDEINSVTWPFEPPKGQRTQFYGEIKPELLNAGIEPDPRLYRDEIDQVYHLVTDLPGIVFTAYQPLELTMPVPAVVVDDTFTIFPPPSADSMVAGQQYKVTSQKHFEQGEYLRAYDYKTSDLSDVDPDFYSRYTRLPERGGSTQALNGGIGYDFTRIRAKSFEVTAGMKTVYEKVKALERFLAANYNYSQNPPSAVPSEKDAVDYFLFDWQYARGHCEYFSTSLAVMARSIGIPTRVVTGYNTGTYNYIKNRYIVQERHAHAWVEIFWPEIGWVEFDPTPTAWYTGIGESASGGWLIFHNAVENLYVYDPQRFINTKVLPMLGSFFSNTVVFTKQRELDFVEYVNPVASKVQKDNRAPYLLLATAFLILIGSIYLRKHLEPDRDRKIILKLGWRTLHRVRRQLIKNGVDPDLIATETDIAQLAESRFSDWGEPVGELVEMYECARYSENQVNPPDVARFRSIAKSVTNLSQN